jgi:hypothetical protein
LLFVLVLTMISGARELMTPGAWEKNGLTYRLKQDVAPPAYKEDGLDGERRQHLEQLREALWQYARGHDGAFPSATDAEVPPERWLVPGSSRRYLYVAGQVADRGATPLAYEPDVHGARRLVLMANGEIRVMEVEDILKALPAEGP